MPRPKKERLVKQPPIFRSFKPTGIRGTNLSTINLALDEFEAIRLTDYQNLDHQAAADEMEISRSTFSRLIEQAHMKIAKFIITGKQLTIDGGNIHFKTNIISCIDCDHMFNIDFGKDFINCPQCGSANLFDLAGGFGHGQCCQNKLNGPRLTEAPAKEKKIK